MNRRIILNVLLSFMAIGLTFAEDTTIAPPLVPVSPEVMSQGAAFVANAHGYNTLFYNPAGFAMHGGPLTVVSSSAWICADPARFFQAMGGDGSNVLTDFVDYEITSGGLGFGFAGGVAFVGKGLGLGTGFNMDSYLHGPITIGAYGNIHATVAFIGGLSLPVNLFGIKFILGADLRPMIRDRASLDRTAAFDILNAIRTDWDPLAALNSVNAMHGFGLGIDLGVIDAA